MPLFFKSFYGLYTFFRMTTLFTDLGLKPQVLKAIEKLGYTEATQIQADVWNAAKD